MEQDFTHQPVMLDKCLEILDHSLDTPRFAIDCTLGLGGHSEAFLQKFPSLFLVGIDKDEEALELIVAAIEKAGYCAEAFCQAGSFSDQRQTQGNEAAP